MLMQQASNEVYTACGFSPNLFVAGSADSLQNAWRLALFGVIAPLGRKVVAELNAKLGDGISLELKNCGRATFRIGRGRWVALWTLARPWNLPLPKRDSRIWLQHLRRRRRW